MLDRDYVWVAAVVLVVVVVLVVALALLAAAAVEVFCGATPVCDSAGERP